MEITPQPMPERDDETGRYVAEHPPEDFIAALRELGGTGPTKAVAEAAGAKYNLTYKRLTALADQGRVESTRVGNAHLWHLVERDAGETAEAETTEEIETDDAENVEHHTVDGDDEDGVAGETVAAAPSDRREPPESGPEDTPPQDVTAAEADEEIYQDGLAVIDDLDLPGSGAKLDRRRAAVRACYDAIREQGDGQRSTFEALLTERDADFGYPTFKSFWNNCVKARDALDLPGVETPGEGEHYYVWVGEEKPHRAVDAQDGQQDGDGDDPADGHDDQQDAGDAARSWKDDRLDGGGRE